MKKFFYILAILPLFLVLPERAKLQHHKSILPLGWGNHPLGILHTRMYRG